MSKTNIYKKALLPVAIASIGLLANPVVAEDSKTLADAFKDGTVKLNFRTRYEDVDVNGYVTKDPVTEAIIDTTEDSDAVTVRSRITYTTAAYKGFTAQIEADNVSSLAGDYNDSVHGNEYGPAIDDPDGTDLNQAWIAYKYGDTNAKYGRQRILIDNQRFVGGVGWRQNEQTYDAFTIQNTSLTNTTIQVSYVNNVKRIFGDDASGGKSDTDSSTWLTNIAYNINDNNKVTLYSYNLDVEDAAGGVQWMNTDTVGIRLNGKCDSFSYQLEYANQEDGDKWVSHVGGSESTGYDADYGLAELNYAGDGFGLLAGYELLGTDMDDDTAKGFFVTPLATLHKFQGWADVFVQAARGNVNGGIEDVYFGASTKVAGIALKVVYHDFGSDESYGTDSSKVDDLGTELDLVATYKVNKNVTLQAKYADFETDTHTLKDTKKFWFTVNMNF